jgi:hypothetical protein
MQKEKIERIDVGSGGVASITFSSIPQSYTDLFLLISGRSGRDNTNEAMRISFNGSTSSFFAMYMLGFGTGVDSGPSPRYAGQSSATTSTANTFSSGKIYIYNYSKIKYTKYSSESATENNNASYAVIDAIAGIWADTTPVTSITLTPDFGNNFLEFSSATLYGITSGSDGITTVS